MKNRTSQVVLQGISLALSFAVLASSSEAATPTVPTIYICRTEQSYQFNWIEGKIEENPKSLEVFNFMIFTETGPDTVIRFNARSDREERGGGARYQLVRKLGEKQDFVAINKAEKPLAGEEYIQSVMRIRSRGDKAGLTFVYMNNASPIFMIAGKCTISERKSGPQQHKQEEGEK